jgi:hypothetical protein
MKKVLTMIGLTAMLASPALAAPAKHYDARGSQVAAAPSDRVVMGGQYLGQDPDANVRLELRRDAFSWND